MKTTAVAPANIAFIKYWGKTDPQTRVPQNNSISMNLSNMQSICTVEFNERLPKDEITFAGEETVESKEIERIVQVLDRIRKLARINTKAQVKTKNNFPKATGIASSASGFAALSLASLTAAGINLNELELSKFARFASGTACRSIPDGFVEWEKGTSSDTSFAKQLFSIDWWDIRDVIVIVTSKMKKVSSTDGHAIADTSPFYEERLRGMAQKIKDIQLAMQAKDFTRFGQILEDEALNMHAICLTSQPALMYWEPTTLAVMKQVVSLRESGELEGYFTIDAGPSVHVICQEKNASTLARKLKLVPGVQQVVINKPARGAHLTEEHLF